MVTGSASGTGEAAVDELRERGASIIGIDVKDPAVDVDQFVHVDLADPTSIDSAAAVITGPIDALFNCAGISAGSGRSALDVYTVNFLGTRHLTELLVPRIIAGVPWRRSHRLADSGGSGTSRPFEHEAAELGLQRCPHRLRSGSRRPGWLRVPHDRRAWAETHLVR